MTHPNDKLWWLNGQGTYLGILSIERPDKVAGYNICSIHCYSLAWLPPQITGLNEIKFKPSAPVSDYVVLDLMTVYRILYKDEKPSYHVYHKDVISKALAERSPIKIANACIVSFDAIPKEYELWIRYMTIGHGKTPRLVKQTFIGDYDSYYDALVASESLDLSLRSAFIHRAPVNTQAIISIYFKGQLLP